MIFWIYSMLFHFVSLILGRRSTWRSGSTENTSGAIWFHASSAGELEILFPLIEKTLEKGRNACVSIFSNSAEHLLHRLPESLLYRGFSPEEGDWEAAFRKFRISECYTSKYEAWPGLWRAASLTDVRMNVVNAQSRSSLKWAKRILKMFGESLPKLRFFILNQEDISRLITDFPDAEFVLTADPRWLRVIQRSQNARNHPKFLSWKNKYSHLPRPYWVIGSAWKEDLIFLSDEIRNFPGTVWIVPHSLKNRPNPKVFRPFPNCVLVDEMGFLVELYSLADRVWVGGGLGQGIHSTLEPAVYKIPVACGPHRVREFQETLELRNAGILTVCERSDQLRDWMKKDHFHPSFQVESKLIGLEKILETLKT